MSKLHPRRLPRRLAFTLILLTLSFISLGATPAPAQAGSQTVGQTMASPCDPNRLIHTATGEYRMFYDQSYASAQRIAAVTNRYRQFYDQSYSAEQRIAAATREYCRGGK